MPVRIWFNQAQPEPLIPTPASHNSAMCTTHRVEYVFALACLKPFRAGFQPKTSWKLVCLQWSGPNKGPSQFPVTPVPSLTLPASEAIKHSICSSGSRAGLTHKWYLKCFKQHSSDILRNSRKQPMVDYWRHFKNKIYLNLYKNNMYVSFYFPM